MVLQNEQFITRFWRNDLNGSKCTNIIVRIPASKHSGPLSTFSMPLLTLLWSMQGSAGVLQEISSNRYTFAVLRIAYSIHCTRVLCKGYHITHTQQLYYGTGAEVSGLTRRNLQCSGELNRYMPKFYRINSDNIISWLCP